MEKFTVLLLVILICTPSWGAFQECYDHGNDGKEPSGAPRLYEIQKPTAEFAFPFLRAVAPGRTKSVKTFRLIIEDVRFTSYKCWDKEKNLTGHDIELMTEAAFRAGYRQIEFVLKPWKEAVINGKKVPSLFVDLLAGEGDAVSAGMSMTPEREDAVHMVGPIYKAGKRLMARIDNPRINPEKRRQLERLPQGDVRALTGLSILVQKSTIRAEYFKKIAEAHPGLIEWLTLAPDQKTLSKTSKAKKILIYETDSPTLESYIDRRMKGAVLGRDFDLVMIDTGSSAALRQEGKLGLETCTVTGNLSTDAKFGNVFGAGDGISFKKGSPLIPHFEKSLAEMVRSGRVDRLIRKWFQDDNAADLSWAQSVE